MTVKPKQRPEALAQFAETARSDKRKDRPGLVADQRTAPIPTDPKAKDEAATKVLQEGATGQDHGAEAAVDRLPDRILESRHSSIATERDSEPEVSMSDRELQQLRNAQLSEGEEDEEIDLDDVTIDVTLEEDELAESGVIDEQAPARMISPEDDYADEDEPGKG